MTPTLKHALLCCALLATGPLLAQVDAVNPQPLPPKSVQPKAVNPQPLPPQEAPVTARNPQPLPVQTGAKLPATAGPVPVPMTLSPVSRQSLPLRPGSLQLEQQAAREDSRKASTRLRAPVAAVPAGTLSAVGTGLTVNDRQLGLKFTPGGQYVIRGRGFGSAGKLFLRGDALGKSLPFTVIAWSDSVIHADLPADISGAGDMAKVTLLIAPTGQAPIENQNFGFLAARESIELAGLPPGATLLTLQSAKLVGRDGGKVWRKADGASLDCFAPGTDLLALEKAQLGNGFEIDGFSFWHDARKGEGNYGSELTPDHQGSTQLAGQYGARWDGANAVRIDWGVFREHRSANILKARPAHDWCESGYEIRLSATGPRGLKPY